jgi:hypothetical protein
VPQIFCPSGEVFRRVGQLQDPWNYEIEVGFEWR